MLPLTEVAATHQRFLTTISGMTDDEVTAPSRLPDWTRGHVLAHLTDAARARARVIQHALRGEQVDMWQPGERDAIIAATAGRSARQHHDAFAESALELERVWSSIQDWTPYETTVWTRWRELLVHLVDLDLGFESTSWDNSFVVHVIDLFSRRLPQGCAVSATDLGRTWGSGAVITGTGRDLACWLLGRRSPISGPQLGGWPSY